MVGPIGFFIFAALAIGGLQLLKVSLPRGPARAHGRSSARIQGRPILTDNEREFFHRLQRALPNHHVFPQVAANAILEIVGVHKRSSAYHASRNRFAQWHVDFVVCERESLAVKAIIELDDKTHVAAKDKKRDDLFEQGGYPVLRFHLRQKSVEAELAALFPGTSSEVPQLPLASIADGSQF